MILHRLNILEAARAVLLQEKPDLAKPFPQLGGAMTAAAGQPVLEAGRGSPVGFVQLPRQHAQRCGQFSSGSDQSVGWEMGDPDQVGAGLPGTAFDDENVPGADWFYSSVIDDLALSLLSP